MKRGEGLDASQVQIYRVCMSPPPAARLVLVVGCAAALAFAGCSTDPTDPVHAPLVGGTPATMLNPLPPDGIASYQAAKVETQPRAIRLSVSQTLNELRHRELSGAATIAFVVDETGTPRNVGWVSATGPNFGDAAAAAVAERRYLPGLLAGVPVRVQERIRIVVRPYEEESGASGSTDVEGWVYGTFKGMPVAGTGPFDPNTTEHTP